ncbi:MAG: 30S ribosomal protein S4 [Candidatus Babeliales bacterium]
MEKKLKDKKGDTFSSQEKQGTKRSRKKSEFGKQLEEKQRLKREYGMRERQFKRFFQLAIQKREGSPGENLLSLLERRLDNVVYQLGMAKSRRHARQWINHGHYRVNGKKVSIPSFLVSVGDEISVSPRVIDKKAETMMSDIDKRMSIRVKVPEWLELMKKDRKGKVLRYPVRSDIVKFSVEEHLIVELYSR